MPRIEGTVKPSLGYEEDCLIFVDPKEKIIGINELLANEDYPNDSVYTAFEMMSFKSFTEIRNEEDKRIIDFHQKFIDGYRFESGKKWPPLFKIKIEWQAEKLTEEEINHYWETLYKENSFEEVLQKSLSENSEILRELAKK